MSMSSISAQLASLNSTAAGGKNVGSSLSTSKRHSDTVGRGVSHSAKHGHSVQPSSARHKPSVLYADSKAASDVPLTTLRENCVSSLRQLAKLTHNDTFVGPQFLQTLTGVHSLNFERGLATRAENDKVDTIIAELLSILSTAMGESASTSTTSCFSSSLYVLEYLLRRYDIHARPNTAERLLLATLAHHEQPVFLRVLQLVDLASLPTWTFLRPFAAKGSPPPNRTVLAKRAAKDDTLIRCCCDMAKTASMIHESECGGELFQIPRRGVSRVISFAAAVVVEALSLQSMNPTHHGSISEPTLRYILPYVLSACGDKKKTGFSLGMVSADWRGFGHVIASCITEKCVLAADAREVLATTLAKGALETERAFETIGLMDDPEAPRSSEAVADSLVTLMTVLSQTPKADTALRLVLLSSKRHSRSSGHVEYLGYALPVQTYRALSKLTCLSKALGHLYSDRNLVVAPFVACLISVAISRLPLETKGSSLHLVLGLIEQSLLEPMWKDAKLNLTASVVASLLSSLAKFPDEQYTTTLAESARSVVDALRGACATGCDAGIAHAVTALCESSNQPAIRRRFALALGLSEDGGRSSDSNEVGTDSAQESSSVPLLPPRVALEHMDAITRLNAIDRLMKEPTLANSGGESLEQALLRHFLTEDELDVTVAAGTALATLLGSRPFDVSLKFADDCFEALCQWTLDEKSIRIGSVNMEQFKKKKKRKDKKKSKRNVLEGKEIIVAALSDERVRVLELALEIAGYTVRSLLTAYSRHSTDDFDIVQEQLIQGIIAHLDLLTIMEKDTKSTHGERIVQPLFDAIGASKQRKTARVDVRTLLLTSERLLDGLRNCWTNSEIRQGYKLSSDFALFRRYFNVYLTVLTDGLDQSGSSHSRELLLARVTDALNASLFMVGWKGESDEVVTFDKKETESLVRCLDACATHARTIEASMLLNAVVELSSVPSGNAYDDVCLPSINRLCDEYAAVHGVSKIVILMEAAFRPGVSGPAIMRLLSLASDCVSSDQRTPATQLADIIIFVLALFGHSDQKIRQAALRLVSMLKNVTTASQEGPVPENEKVLRDYVSFLGTEASNASTFVSSIVMDGSSALPAFLGGSLLQSKDPCRLRIEVLRSCCRTACAIYASNDASDGKKRWLSSGEGVGGCRAAVLILNALELSGEATFPLVDRYKYAGQGVLGVLLEACKDSSCREVTTAIADLINSVARMMKGITVVDASSVESDISAMIISTGPNARGTRARSYSVGRSVGVSFIEPYPKDMYDDIIKCLSFRDVEAAGTDAVMKEICRAVINEVLGSQSWVHGVFKKMDRGSRRELLSSLLSLRMTETFDCAGEAFLGLPADGTDMARLIWEVGAEKPNLASFIFLSDYIHIHSERLRNGPGYSELVSLLFQSLEMVSSNEYQVDDVDDIEFARQCLLSSLACLLPAEAASDKDERKLKLPKKHLATYASLLGALVGDTDARSGPVRPLPLGRPRTLAFSLLTSLCSIDSSSIVASLVPAMLASIVVQSDSDVANHPPKRGYGAPRDALLSVVPVFVKYSKAANLTLFDLFSQFFAKCSEVSDERDKMELYSCMVDAIMAIPPEYFEGTTPVGIFVAAFLAFDLRNDGPVIAKKTSSSTVVATDILLFAPPITQVAALIQLIGYANSFLLKISGADDDGDHRKVSKDSSIADLEDPCARSVTMSILTVVLDLMQSASLTKLVKKCDGTVSKFSLRLWRDLLVVQSTSMQAQDRVRQKLKCKSNAADSQTEDGASETSFLDECQSVIDTSLELVQSLLPAHLFLASVASLIQNSTDSELCSRAIRFVSERAAEIDADSPESSLFLDLLPMLVALLASSSEAPHQAEPESVILVQQSVMVAVETLARKLCLQSSKDTSGRFDSFTMALNHASLLIKTHSAPLQGQDQVISAVEGTSCQLLCSAALCASSVVRVLKASSLPLLSTLIEPLLAVLSLVNDALSRNPSHWGATDRGQAILLRLSIFRALMAIADCLPQFLGPYLDRLLSPSVLLSLSRRSESSEHQLAVNSTTTRLEAVLARKIPARQLIPSLCKVVPECKRNGEFQALLAILKESVQQAPRSELPPLRSWILRALTLAYEFRGGDGGDDESVDLVDDANGVLLAVVMKLSESQLRPLYVKLREWRGDVVSQPDYEDVVALRRRAFWSLSAVLSTELRAIFLPCLSTVVSDSVNDLEFAIAHICGSVTSTKVEGGKKRRRLETSEIRDAEPVRFLKPLLHCLESALHADASDGGKWVRSDDSQRYHSLLSPLSRLLELRISSNISFVSKFTSESAFQQLVHGAEDEPGSVIGCLTALATAAGNEQLWKPLNHAILEACGNESRAEVRKGGVSCLLSLINALGEEYMVLLPECLPVLSELLEDSDEEIAGLAQKCVSIGEELLGESLQESLR